MALDNVYYTVQYEKSSKQQEETRALRRQTLPEASSCCLSADWDFVTPPSHLYLMVTIGDQELYPGLTRWKNWGVIVRVSEDKWIKVLRIPIIHKIKLAPLLNLLGSFCNFSNFSLSCKL